MTSPNDITTDDIIWPCLTSVTSSDGICHEDIAQTPQALEVKIIWLSYLHTVSGKSCSMHFLSSRIKTPYPPFLPKYKLTNQPTFLKMVDLFFGPTCSHLSSPPASWATSTLALSPGSFPAAVATACRAATISSWSPSKRQPKNSSASSCLPCQGHVQHSY